MKTSSLGIEKNRSVSVISNIPMQMSDIKTAATAIVELATSDATFLVITPNIQHFYIAQTDIGFLQILKEAEFLLPDGWPVVAGMRLLDGYRGKRITGADLMMEVLKGASSRGLSVGLMGGSPGVADRAAVRARSLHPKLDVISLDSPMFESGREETDLARLLESVPDQRIDLLFLCIGTPKSELLAFQAMSRLNCGAILCFGAAIDFLSGDRPRAPHLLRLLHLEWLYRIRQEPTRLLPRYLKAAPKFALIVASEAIRRIRSTP